MLLLAACPKKPPEPAVKPVEAQPPAPLLVHSFDELSVDFYPELQALEEGAPRLTELARTRDVDQWTAVRSVWGLLPVIEFLDTDRRHSALSASAGWFITTQEDGTELIEAVLVRDFEDAPAAEAPEALMIGLAESWPPPWTLCQPRNRIGVVAYDSERRVKLGLDPIEGNEGWSVDHVEFFSPSMDLEAWWDAKDYGGCDELGTVTEGLRFRPARKSKDE
ncbi:MAG: hypothetical protein GY898_13515 [Proteobacteria bacterium]|nr:hypothetical protein [Pseudomonadota bacterium]